ncbi:MAG TPA: ATP-binding protein, partial [Vicinamibacteria bacterium]|jgi:PAS domain S-box-containing protein|nr:ATP-binding protein [Vicinamibacteria bacterium]
VTAFAGVDAAPEFFASLDTLRRQMILLGLASVVTAGAGGLLLVRQASRRLQRLREIVSRVSRGDFADRAGVSGSDEIGALGQDLDGMVTSLVEARDYYESVLASVDVGLLATDRAGRVIGANARTAQILDRSEKDLAGHALSEVLTGTPRLLAFADTLLHGDSVSVAEEIPLGPEAGGRLVAVMASRLRQAGEWTGMILSISDVTEVRALERRLRRNEQLAGLGSMAAGLLHEVRNPLASMTMYLDLMRPLATPGEGQDLVDRAIREAARLDRFLHDFQIFAGLRPLRRGWVDLRAVVEEGTEGLSAPPGVIIARRLGEETPMYVDRSLLAHAVRNLVANAIEAVGPTGRIVLELERAASGVVLSVTDDGRGVPPADLERIFDPLFTTKRTGTGLGLTIVQSVAEAHGATVEIRPAVPRGVTFALRWPAASGGN